MAGPESRTWLKSAIEKLAKVEAKTAAETGVVSATGDMVDGACASAGATLPVGSKDDV